MPGPRPGAVLRCAAVTDAARPSPSRAPGPHVAPRRQIVLFLVLMLAYEWVRDLVAMDDPARPLRHALDVIDVEKTLGFFVEPTSRTAPTRWPASSS